MRRSFISCAIFLFAIAACASTGPELFQKAKDQFRLRAYSDALATLERLDPRRAHGPRHGLRPSGPPTWIGEKALTTGDDELGHYRRDLLPSGVPYHQVDFDFLTRRGYGTNVLQREDQSLKTLEAARRAEPAWFVGNKAPR